MNATVFEEIIIMEKTFVRNITDQESESKQKEEKMKEKEEEKKEDREVDTKENEKRNLDEIRRIHLNDIRPQKNTNFFIPPNSKLLAIKCTECSAHFQMRITLFITPILRFNSTC
jgi:spore cortex formation protein SpoVR/YcgB (stage V sporulation)